MIQTTLNFLEEQKKPLGYLLFLLTLLTLSLTLLPVDRVITSNIWQYDKIAHAVLFGTWTFVLGLYLLFATKKELPLFAIFLIGAFFGITIEILQEILPINRTGDLNDALADIFGCFIAVLALKWLTRKA
ncbi:MAG: VanZ family protein [Balneolaceae bacterium]